MHRVYITFIFFFFFFNDTATTEIYTLSLHDALPISHRGSEGVLRPIPAGARAGRRPARRGPAGGDRKSTRLNSSHTVISYAVFCLKKKNSYSMMREKDIDELSSKIRSDETDTEKISK